MEMTDVRVSPLLLVACPAGNVDAFYNRLAVYEAVLRILYDAAVSVNKHLKLEARYAECWAVTGGIRIQQVYALRGILRASIATTGGEERRH